MPGCSNYPECTFTLAEHFRKKKLTKTNVKELLEGKETLVKGIKTKDRKSYNAVVKIGEKGYIDFIYVWERIFWNAWANHSIRKRKRIESQITSD